jgi:adenosylhomocysteinase
MDMSFANQVLAAIHLKEHGKGLENRVHPVPADIDAEIARLKLAAMDIRIDALTPEQTDYLSSWREGT